MAFFSRLLHVAAAVSVVLSRAAHVGASPVQERQDASPTLDLSLCSILPIPTYCPTGITLPTATGNPINTPKYGSGPEPPLSCDRFGYLIQAARLYRVDLQTGQYTVVIEQVGSGAGINAIGYNVRDNYLYGATTGGVIRIASDGSSAMVTQVTTPLSPGSIVGDFDLAGQYWVSAGGRSWQQFDLSPGSPTFGNLVSNGSSPLPPGIGLADWVHLPSLGRYLYSIASNSTSGGFSMLRFSMDTHRWEPVANYPNLRIGSGFGAMYGMDNGTVYASNNQNGEIWQFPVGGRPFRLSSGPISSSNDGARCVLNLLR